MLNDFNTRLLYIDMDGVIADYESAVPKYTGKTIQQWKDEKKWDKIKETLANSDFFLQLETMPLVEVLKKHIGKFEILTAVGHNNSEVVVQLKSMWLDQVFGVDAVKMNWVYKSHEKQHFARHDTLLVDDRKKSCIPFANNDGQVMLFSNTPSQIDMVDQILSKIPNRHVPTNKLVGVNNE